MFNFFYKTYESETSDSAIEINYKKIEPDCFTQLKRVLRMAQKHYV